MIPFWGRKKIINTTSHNSFVYISQFFFFSHYRIINKKKFIVSSFFFSQFQVYILHFRLPRIASLYLTILSLYVAILRMVRKKEGWIAFPLCNKKRQISKGNNDFLLFLRLFFSCNCKFISYNFLRNASLYITKRVYIFISEIVL